MEPDDIFDYLGGFSFIHTYLVHVYNIYLSAMRYPVLEILKKNNLIAEMNFCPKLDSLRLIFRAKPSSKADSIADSDASAASSGGKWELT